MVEQVEEVAVGRVPPPRPVTVTVAGEQGVVMRKHPARSDQTEEVHAHRRRPASSHVQRLDLAGREGDAAVDAEADHFLRWIHVPPDGLPVRTHPLEQVHRLEEAEGGRVVPQLPLEIEQP